MPNRRRLMTAVREKGEDNDLCFRFLPPLAVRQQVRRSWGWLFVFGIVLMILGVLCVGRAQTATTFSILALGWVLAISGVLWLVNSFFAFSWHGFFLYLLNAIIRGVTGYLLIRHSEAGAAAVTMLLACLFIVGEGCSALPGECYSVP